MIGHRGHALAPMAEIRPQTHRMDLLREFIGREREHYSRGEDSNRFAFSLGQSERYFRFLKIIYDRYRTANERFSDVTRRLLERTQERGSGPVDPELQTLFDTQVELQDLLHLEIESFYLFGTAFLDRAAVFLEDYFGKPSIKGRVDRHRALKNKLSDYAAEKKLMLPDGFIESVAYLETELAEFRDKQIVHDRSWRSTHATSWDASGDMRIMKLKYAPRTGDAQQESKSLRILLEAVEKYIVQLIELIETNRSKTVYRHNE